MFLDGADFEKTYETTFGPVGVLAEVQIHDQRLVLNGLSIYPIETNKRLPIGVRRTIEILRSIERDAADQGLQRVHCERKETHRSKPGAYSTSCEEAEMNSSSASIDLSAIRVKLQDSVTAGISREELIRTMRLDGLNQIDCIKMLRDLSGIALGDAKEAVHYSQAWADCREMNETFHEAAFRAADELGLVEVER